MADRRRCRRHVHRSAGARSRTRCLPRRQGVIDPRGPVDRLEDQSIGFIAGLAELETDLAVVIGLVHGPTVATNAVLERKGAVMNAVADAGANINIPATPERMWRELSAHVGGT